MNGLSKWLSGILAAIMAMLVAWPACASIITNGNFQAPSIIGVPLPYRVVFNSHTDITGWNVGGVSVDIVDAIKTGNTAWAYDGRQSIDLTGSPGPGSIYQDV